MGFEQPVAPDRTEALPIQVQDDAPNTRSLLRLRSGALTYDAAAIMPWGGYVSPPYTVRTNSANDQDRWVVQPLEFLREALRLPQMPVPDTTTENGRRLLTIHIDGDGFASKAEIPGGGYAGEVLLREIFDRYRLPMTMSVIEGEVGKAGMYPQLSAELEPIARKIFAQPYVEVASHTYSHPFEWQRTVAGKSDAKVVEGDEDYHLRIPGYRMDLNREIGGSIDYINRVLSPNKPVKMLLWPGDCQAPPEALKLTDAAGVLNMNGGDTMITRSNPTWTAIAPLGINKADDTFQVFATNQNENIYTNLWHGPYYGFERLVETWELTDKPYRFKAMNIYYHSYSGTKVASLKALRTVYDYALKQPVLPIHSTDYVLKVLDWQGMAVARELGDGAAGAGKRRLAGAWRWQLAQPALDRRRRARRGQRAWRDRVVRGARRWRVRASRRRQRTLPYRFRRHARRAGTARGQRPGARLAARRQYHPIPVFRLLQAVLPACQCRPVQRDHRWQAGPWRARQQQYAAFRYACGQ